MHILYVLFKESKQIIHLNNNTFLILKIEKIKIQLLKNKINITFFVKK